MLKESRNLALLCLLCAPLASAQVLTGPYPFGTFDSKGIDTINVGSLNVHLSIPVVQRAGRGIPFSYALAYDSSVWQIVGSGGGAYWEPVQNWGWLGQTVIATGYLSYSTQTYVCDWPLPKHGSYYFYYNWVYHDAYGGSHTFGDAYMEYDPTGCDSTVTGFTAQTSDDAALTLTTNSVRGIPTGGNNIIANPSGLQIKAPINNYATGSTITDTNGNQISVNSSGVYTDTTGVTAMTVAQSPGYPTTFTYPTPTGTATYTMKYSTYNVQTNFGCSSVTDYSASGVSLVSEIDLPDSSKYTFTYETTPGNPSDVTGRIASITLPTGGAIAYTYSGANNGIECSDGSTAGLTRTLSSDPAGAIWSYVRTVGSGTSQTVVSDKTSNQTVYNFVSAGASQSEYYETNRAVYQGTATGTPLLQRETCYNNTPSSCVTSAFSMPISQVDTYETLNGIQMHGATAFFNSNGMQTEQDVYDYGGSSSRGSPLEKETWAYGYSIASDVTEDDVYDGSSNQIGKTIYQYDITGTTASSGVPQHVSVSGPRGNLDQVESYYNSTTFLGTMNTSYEDTGSPISVSTPNGTMNYSYDSTWTYQTGVTLPTPSSGVSLTESAQYDSTNSGVLQWSKDPNSQQTSISSYDSLIRPLEVDYPDGGKTTYAYSIYGSNPAQVGVHRYQTSSTYADTEAQIDGYGRTSRAEIANGQSGNGWYQQDVCYDADGNVNFTSYVYQGAGFLGNSKRCSSSGDSATYDALGRALTVVRSNGETVTHSYDGRATKAVDQNGVTRILQIDGLGRTTTVCEISSNSSMPGSGSPTSCGTDITGTGFITSFAYNLASHQTTITQGVGVQTRTFQTDWLGRTTSVTEPETGTTTYSYSYNSTGLAVSRVRPKANQSSPSVQTTTTTQYDSLGRLVSISYTDGTPTKTYAYDASAGSAWSDLPQSNLKGRLSLASVSNAGSAYSYDAMGRVTYLDSCLPSGCPGRADAYKCP